MECDNSTVKCDVGTTQCDDEIVKCEKKKLWKIMVPSNVTKVWSHVKLFR